MIIFVTGTNTDVGKTVATAALASAFAQSGREVVYARPASRTRAATRRRCGTWPGSRSRRWRAFPNR